MNNASMTNNIKPWLTKPICLAAMAAVAALGIACEDDPEIELDESASYSFVAAQENEMRATQSEGEALSITKQMPSNVKVGSPFTYVIEVANTSGSELAGVTVNESLPEGFEIRKSDPKADSNEGGELTWKIGRLGEGQARQIRVTGVAQQAGDMNVCTTYDFERGVCAPLSIVNPTLAITRTIPRQANICEPAMIQYVVRNTGTTPAEDVVLYEVLPDGVIYEGGQTIEMDLGNIPAGGEVTTDVQIIAEQPTTFESYAMAKSELDQVESKSGAITFVGPQLELSVNATRDYEYVGKDARFEVVVSNTGDGVAQDVSVAFGADNGEVARVGAADAAQPGEAQLARGEMGAYKDAALDIGSLEPGQQRSFFVEVNSAELGELNLAAIAQSYCEDAERVLAEQSAKAMLEIQPIVALQVEVVDKADPVRVGEQTTYEIVVLNEGSADDANLNVTAALPQGLKFVSAEGITEVTNDGQSLTFAPVVTLAAGDAAVWYVTVEATEAAGQGNFKLEVKSNKLPKPVIEEEPTRTY